MTDRVHSLTVVLSQDMREDSPTLEMLMQAIRMLRNVTSVDTHVSDFNSHMASERAHAEWRDSLYALIEDKANGH